MSEIINKDQLVAASIHEASKLFDKYNYEGGKIPFAEWLDCFSRRLGEDEGMKQALKYIERTDSRQRFDDVPVSTNLVDKLSRLLKAATAKGKKHVADQPFSDVNEHAIPAVEKELKVGSIVEYRGNRYIVSSINPAGRVIIGPQDPESKLKSDAVATSDIRVIG